MGPEPKYPDFYTIVPPSILKWSKFPCCSKRKEAKNTLDIIERCET